MRGFTSALTLSFMVILLMGSVYYMAGMSLGATATLADSDLVTTMFQSVGKIHVVDEKLLNAVTGVRYTFSPASNQKALYFFLQINLYKCE